MPGANERPGDQEIQRSVHHPSIVKLVLLVPPFEGPEEPKTVTHRFSDVPTALALERAGIDRRERFHFQ